MALGSIPSGFGFDPFAELRRMQSQMDQLFSRMGAAVTREFPPVNLWLGDNSVVVTAELPGVGRNEVSVNLQEDVLTLEGERRPPQEEGNARWHRRERGYGSFSRTIQLPFRVDPNNAQSRFTNGILEIELYRPQEDRPKKIEIRAA
jgi:HSP20 family protein